jgi:hypothetical protein
MRSMNMHINGIKPSGTTPWGGGLHPNSQSTVSSLLPLAALVLFRENYLGG